ncbi:MFS general substrate transporter [Apiospora rasikravindrae]|uniref:MFS general substrate transporter n=1 Tax=Apiospora rasikravindrae TaxID=990691 RepID=A0ABR1T6F0_9PEZI
MRCLETLRQRPAYVVGVLTIAVFLVQMGLTLTDIPSTSLIQEYVCIRQNPGVDPDSLTPEQCQTISVVREVNVIQMLSTLTAAAPAILTALVYGALADIVGRKLVFLLSLSGILIFQIVSMVLAMSVPTISVESLSVAGLFLFIGGGIGVAEAMVFTIISDPTYLSDASHTTYRTISFQIEICSVFLAEVVAAVSTPSLMSPSTWVPLQLGLGLTGAGVVFVFALPETLKMILAPPSQYRQRTMLSTLAELMEFLASLRHNSTPIWLLTPAAALTMPIATTTASILTRTVPFRYSTTFAASSSLVAVRAGTTIFVLLVLLPPLLIFYNRRHLGLRQRSEPGTSTTSSPSQPQLHPLSQDLDLARAFALFPVLGTLILAASSTTHGAIAGVVIFTLGAPVPGLARTVLARLVEPAHRGRFFGMLAVVEQTGFLVVGLFLSGLLDAGLRNSEGREGQWLGLPLYLAAFMFALLALGLWLAHPRELQQPVQPERE